MGSTYQDLIDRIHAAYDANYRSDPEREQVTREAVADVVVRMLEKLRDQFDPS